jgi:hypothetical protein
MEYAFTVLIVSIEDAGHWEHLHHHLPPPPPSHHPPVQSSWYSFIETQPESVCLNTS